MAAMFTAMSHRCFHATNVHDFGHFNLRSNVNSFKNISYTLNVRHLKQDDCNSNLVVVNAAAASGHTSQGNKANDDNDNENNRHFKTQVESLLETIKWDEKGLVVAIAQHIDTGAILMQGFANKDAVSRTLMSCKATFYSRKRSSLWTKGETSSNFINVTDVFLDCDHDSIIYLGKPDGPTCHTGMETCYFTAASDFVKNPNVEVKRLPLTSLYSLEDTIFQRKSDLADLNFRKPSWTKKLFDDHKLLCSKIRSIFEALRMKFASKGVQTQLKIKSKGEHVVDTDLGHVGHVDRPQLQLKEKSHFQQAHDAFLMYITWLLKIVIDV